MANEIFFPYLNPLSFTQLAPAEIPAYMSRYIDLFRFRDTIKNYEQKVCWPQPWMTTDTINLQLISNYGPLNMTLHNGDGDVMAGPFTFTTGQQDFFRPGYYIRTLSQPLTGITGGYYYWQLQVGSSNPFVTEPQYITDSIPNTLYAQYKNYERYGDIIFETGIELNMRIPSVLNYRSPASKDTIYEDQPMNQTMIKSVPYRLWEWVIGDAKGVPPWFADKCFRIAGCSDMKLDGILYTKNEGAELEQNQADLYPMAGYKIEMREKINKDSIGYIDDGALIGYGSMMAVSDTKGFGIDGDFIPINDVQ